MIIELGTVALLPPRNSTLIATVETRDEADELVGQNTPAMIRPAYDGGFEIWRLGR